MICVRPGTSEPPSDSEVTADNLAPCVRFRSPFIYALVSQRARGISVGVNLNPDKACNFDCVYCEVDRSVPGGEPHVDAPVMARKLQTILELIAAGGAKTLPGLASVPHELTALKEVALSGDGEPTLCPNFEQVVEAVLHVRARGAVPFFKLVLLTNGTGLHREQVARALKLLTFRDEIWIKLDVGSQAGLERINRPKSVGTENSPCLSTILQNIIRVGRERSIVIQSLFPSIDGRGPSEEEIAAYLKCLEKIRAAGAKISLVQVYSVHRPAIQSNCRHLVLKELSSIARRIRTTGLSAEVF